MGKKVVVVDDEQDLCRILEIAIRVRNMEIEVHKAHDGISGLALIEKVRPDLVILDVKMPKANGYEVLNRIRQDVNLKDTPVIMLTSLTQDTPKTDDQWQTSMDVAGFFSKPYDTEKLLQTVESVLGVEIPKPQP